MAKYNITLEKEIFTVFVANFKAFSIYQIGLEAYRVVCQPEHIGHPTGEEVG